MPSNTSKMVRLNKFIANSGLCSRRSADDYIEQGRVAVNGEVVMELGTKIDADDPTIEVTVNGKPINSRNTPHQYIMLNKPAGYVVTMTKRHRERTVIDLLPRSLGPVKPVGRLDKATTGLLILTTDGDLIQRYTHPSFQHEKEYHVTTRESISDAELSKLSEGTSLEEGHTGRNKVRRLDSNSFSIVLTQGWNRQIRRMVEAIDKHIVSLERVRVGKLTLGTLPVKQWQIVTKDMIE